MGEWRNWQTRWLQEPVGAIPWRFESSPAHHIFLSQNQDTQLSMKPLVCIFAHPDDEAFGPGGTIAKFAKVRDVYLICTTKGEMGSRKNGKMGKNLGDLRADELRKSAKVLGIKKVFFLGFRDGTLSNNLYHGLARKIENIVRRLRPDTLVTYEPRGVSGHIDHIAVSMISNYVFERLPFIKKLMQFCITAERAKMCKRYFVYRPPGYKKSEIDLTINVEDTWNSKTRAMLQHQSQIGDVKRSIKIGSKFPKQENFLIRTK